MYAEILLNIPFLRKSYFYKVPSPYINNIQRFCRVKVHFKEKKILGLITQVYDTLPPHLLSLNPNTIQPFEKLLDIQPVFLQEQFNLAQELSQYYASPLSEVVFTMIPKGIQTRRSKETSQKHPFFSQHVLHSLLPKQKQIYKRILSSPNNKLTQIHLVHGITGSGKTLLYIKLIQKYLEQGYGVIFLIPEITLSYQVVEQFTPIFGSQMANINSSIPKSTKWHEYKKLLDRKAKLVTGTRSAIFAPVFNLKLIIIDEEHDISYKEHKQFRYHAKEVATLRLKKTAFSTGESSKCLPTAIVLGSATPSLESYYLAKSNRIHYHTIQKRATQTSLPTIHIVSEKIGLENIISSFLQQKMEEHLHNDKQVLLLLNRRGYATHIYCNSCRNVQKCIRCSVSLIYHQKDIKSTYQMQDVAILKCHFCGYQEQFFSSTRCKICYKKTLKTVGYGTQKIEEVLEKNFPNIPFARLDKDTTRAKNYASEVLQELHEKKIKILIGTQMIAKGLDIENITLVGILNTDIGLFIPDFRSYERIFQILSQTSGRAGRHSTGGEVVFQTNNPEHYIIQTSSQNNYIKFAKIELATRQKSQQPPYKKIMRLIIESKKISRLSQAIQSIQKSINEIRHPKDLFSLLENTTINTFENIDVYGPVEAPIYKIKSKYRIHYIIKANSYRELQNFRDTLYGDFEQKKYSFNGVHMICDLNPLDLL